MTNPTHFPAADGIRGFACLIVLALHTVVIFFEATNPALAGAPKIGVWLFFVLSAFLLSSKLASTGFSWATLSDYAGGRALRIVPLFLISVLVYALAGVITWQQAVETMTLTAGPMHFWTIPVELKFYVALPAVVFVLAGAFRYAGTLGVALTTLAGIYIQQMLWPYWATPQSSIITSWYFSSFLCGTCIAICYRATDGARLAKYRDVLGSLILVAIIASIPGARYMLLDTPMTNDLLDKHLPLSILWCAFILLFVGGSGTIGELLQHKWIVLVGAWSYPIYLFHFLILVVTAKFFPGNLPAAAGAFIASIIVGGLVHKWVEFPLNKLRTRTTERRKAAITSQAGHHAVAGAGKRH
ncbi:MAG TPA: acyltransferase [Pseudomonas sp.]|nr:acyltransferase [Pseudomonas sp.]